MGHEILRGQTQNGVNLDFLFKFDIDVQGLSSPNMIETLTKVFAIFGPNLVILAA